MRSINSRLRQGELLAAGSVSERRRQLGLAGLVVVQLTQAAEPPTFSRELDGLGLVQTLRHDGRFECEIAGGGKLALLQRLAAHPAIAYIRVQGRKGIDPRGLMARPTEPTHVMPDVSREHKFREEDWVEMRCRTNVPIACSPR
jgi:hypothetical protein